MPKYEIIHKESPDHGGIDVALLYVPSSFKPLKRTWYRVNFPFAPKSRTRDILYVKGIIGRVDTIHVFVNHWPSKNKCPRSVCASLWLSSARTIRHPDYMIVLEWVSLAVPSTC